jgi:hypothetical protein
VTHCALSAQHIQKFAKADPFVYVGDFNIKPLSSQYELLTRGSLDKNVRLFSFITNSCSCALTFLFLWYLVFLAPSHAHHSHSPAHTHLCSYYTAYTQHPDYPQVEEGDSWTPEVKPPLSSAYVTKEGAEPDFTNYAKVQEDPTFIETLDYIFHSKGWQVDSVLPLPHRDTVAGPLPNKDEPSDHILISARMSLK